MQNRLWKGTDLGTHNLCIYDSCLWECSTYFLLFVVFVDVGRDYLDKYQYLLTRYSGFPNEPMMTADLVSLPPALLRKISEFSEAKDILSLSSTCHSVHRELNISVLAPPYELFYSQHYSASPLRQALQIPIFFAQHCHSVRLTCHWSDPGAPERPARLYIVSRPKHDMPPPLHPQMLLKDHQGNAATIVWNSPPLPKKNTSYALEMDVTFRHDPSNDYFLWYQCPLYLLIEHFQVHRLLVWEDGAHRKETYAKCMELEAMGQEELFSDRVEPHDAFCSTKDYQSPAFSFVARLFALTVTAATSEQPSPIHTLLESLGRSTNLSDILRPLSQLANIFEQLVEQKEPEHCRATLLPQEDQGSNCHIVTLPWIPLKTEFGWVPKEDLKEVPRFITRIPLAPHTKSLRLKGHRGMCCHGRCTFFLFAQIHQNYLNGSEDWVFGNNKHCRRHLYAMADADTELDVCFDVDAHAEAYFLYVVPDKSTMDEISGLQVQLKIVEDGSSCSLKLVMEHFLGAFCGHESSNPWIEGSFPLSLLRAVAQTLQQCSSGPTYNALANFLEQEGFSTVTQGLECIVMLIDSISEQRMDSQNGEKDDNASDATIIQNFSAM